MPIPPLELFVAFERVAETGSISVAGKMLGLSKATVSKQITALEAALGVSLVSRTTRRLALTGAGERLLVRARRILEEAEGAMEDAGEARLSPRGRLKISAPLSFGLTYLGPVLPDFLKSFPDIQLDLSVEDRLVDLIGGGFDAALRIGSMPDSSLTARRLASVQMHLVGTPAYWNKRGRPQRPEDLAGHACFQYANAVNGSIWRFRGPSDAEASVRIEGPLAVNTADIAMPSLYAGLGCMILPDFITWQDIKSGRLESPLPDWRLADINLHLLTPPGRGAPRTLRVFSDFLVERFGGGKAPWLGG